MLHCNFFSVEWKVQILFVSHMALFRFSSFFHLIFIPLLLVKQMSYPLLLLPLSLIRLIPTPSSSSSSSSTSLFPSSPMGPTPGYPNLPKMSKKNPQTRKNLTVFQLACQTFAPSPCLQKAGKIGKTCSIYFFFACNILSCRVFFGW